MVDSQFGGRSGGLAGLVKFIACFTGSAEVLFLPQKAVGVYLVSAHTACFSRPRQGSCNLVSSSRAQAVLFTE